MKELGYEIKVRRSDGYVFNYESDDWALLKVSGIDFASIEVFTESKGIGDGDIVTGWRRQSRAIEITATLRKFNQNTYAQNRAQVMGFHNVNYSYDLIITYLGITMIAKNCVIKAASYPSERYRKNSKMTVMFLSPDADLYADSSDNVSFVNTEPMWHCTRAYEGIGGSLAFGAIEKASEKVINYLGTEATPIEVTIKASGYVNGITVSIGDKTTTITTKLYESDVLVIDTDERLVTKNGTPVPMTEYDATELMAIKLGYGDNVVKVDSPSTAFTAEVDFVGRYGGL